MKTAILTHKDPGNTGGYEKLLVSLSRALDGHILNVFKDRWNPDDYDYFVAIDEVSAHYLPKDRPHTLYMTTPRRSLYDMYSFAPTYQKPIIWMLRVVDRKTVNAVRDIVCISHNVRNRIYKTYQREAEVIYPCINPSEFYTENDLGFWLAVQRIDKWKRIPMIIDTFRDMPDETLILFGALDEKKKNYRLISNLPDNVIWETGDDKYLAYRYSTCSGVISMGVDEDFGIVPIEAFASGKHVIAPMEGGYLETVKGIGTLIHPTKKDLMRAVQWSCGCNNPSRRIDHARAFQFDIFRDDWITHAKFITSEN